MSLFGTDARPEQAFPHPGSAAQWRTPGAVAGTSTRNHTRRAAVRFLAGCALAAPALWRAPSAHAIKGWCRRDPIVKIGDLTVQIVLFSESEMHELATGPTELVIKVPAGTATRFLADDPGFGHFGYAVRFAESQELVTDGNSVAVQVEAYVPAEIPAAGPIPLVLEFTPRGGGLPTTVRAEGLANEWVRLQASLAAPDLGKPDDTPPVTPPSPPEHDPGDTPPAGGQGTKGKKKRRKGRGKKRSS